MKKSIQNRIRKGLFPEMPQSFADRLTGTLKIGGAFNADQRSAEEAPTAPVLPERSKRRFPFGKIFNGVAAAVLAALCIVIAVFGIILPNVQKTHGATHPDGYRADFPVGKWTRTRSKYASQGTDYSWIDVDMESWQSWLEITADGHAHLTEYDSESGKALHADFSVAIGSDGIQTDWESCTGMWYDTAADTICMEIVGRRRDYYSRTPDAVIPESKMSPEDMLEGLWCALSVDPGEDGLLEIRFYTEAAATERKALIVKDGVSYDGYSYTVEKWEQSQKNTGNLWYRFTFIDGDEELTIDLCMDTDGKEPIYMDWNLDKSEEGQKTYLKCPVIEANELPMQYTEYYGAGEGFVGFLAAVDLNGDGNPVRVKVTSDDPNWFIEKGEEPELTVQIGRGEWTANEVLVWDSVIFADLDPNDGHGNVLLSVKRTDGTIFTYELHSEDDTVVCGHVAEGDSNTYAMSTNINLYEKTSVGAWSHTVGVGYEQRITIRADGTATLKQTAGALGTFEVQLTYTETDGKLQFVSAYTGRNDSFTAVYDAERDVLAVTRNGETAEYERCIPDLAGSKWTLMDMKKISGNGIDAGGDLNEPELIGPEMYLEFDADGTVTVTVLYGDETVRRTFRSIANGTSIDIPDADETVITDTLEYDAATDTLRMYYVSYSGLQADMIFSRTPDAVIPAGERKEIAELRKQYPEYFGLDTSKGLKVYVWQMAESSYSCALLKGSDNKTEAEIGGMKGVTIEQMRLILSTYGLEEKEIEVVPFHNPISSYWYEIDNDYKVWIRRLVKENMPFTNEELEGLKSPPFSIADVVYDVDGDGQLETCSLNRGPTSSDITVVFTVYRNGTLAYRNTFDMDEGEMTFSRSNDGLRIKRVWNDGIQIHTEYSITIENGMIVLTDEIRGGTVEYWGLDDPQWNMAVVKTPEERLEGLWCAMSAEEGQDGLLEIGFYKDAATGKRMVFYWGGDFRYNGYSYTVEEQESRWSDEAYLFTLTDGDEICRITLYLYHQGDMRIDMDVDGKSYKKLTPITAEELPMKQDKYIGAGEGKVYYLDLVDLNGDGKPVRVSVYGYTPVSVVTGEEGESELTVQIGACEWKINEKLVMDSGIYIDLDPNDGHGNLLLSTTRADGTERTYELHVENGELVCGHTVEGYCFLNDSEQQELMLGTPTDLLGAKYGYREVKGEALEPADEWLQASALIERVMFGKREDNIKDGMLLHLVRALPCEIDGKPATLEPGVYMHLREWNEAMTEIVFLTEDDRWITVYLDGTAPYTVGGVPLADYFDNAPKG